MNKKCKRVGCYEPADCRHGYCKNHCGKRHEKYDYSCRVYPKSRVPHVGVEIEVIYSNDQDLRRGVSGLKAHHDASLGAYGAEYKVLGPASKIVKRASSLLHILWCRRAKITPKCGLHVHLDAREAQSSRLEQLFAWAYATQDTWFGLVPPSRRENCYCAKLMGPKTPWNHHAWINKSGHNTVEVRLHSGTLNPHKMAGWLEVLKHVQKKFLDNDYTFPTEGEGVDKFWKLFEDAPKVAREYLQTRLNNGGLLKDYAYQPNEEVLEVAHV